jgi:hypothetical protein
MFFMSRVWIVRKKSGQTTGWLAMSRAAIGGRETEVKPMLSMEWNGLSNSLKARSRT